jgi:hypothetical protein
MRLGAVKTCGCALSSAQLSLCARRDELGSRTLSPRMLAAVPGGPPRRKVTYLRR